MELENSKLETEQELHHYLKHVKNVNIVKKEKSTCVNHQLS